MDDARGEYKIGINMHVNRLKNIYKEIQTAHCDAFLIEDKTNLFYMTGISLSAGKLLIAGGEATLLVDGRYLESAKKNSPFPVHLDEPDRLQILLKGFSSLGFDSLNTSFKRYGDLQGLLPGTQLVPLENPVRKIRMIKDSSELELLQEAAELGSKGFDFIAEQLRDGVTELELATELDIFWKRRGGQGLAFEPIIAFGKNASMPHYRAGDAKLQRGDAVLIDIGVVYKNYHSDMTRMVFYGEPASEILEICRVVQEAQQLALSVCRPGITAGELDQAARGYIQKCGYGDCFTHSLGHGVGLEIHEPPLLRDKEPYRNTIIEEGMVITIEPGIYLPGTGGARMEDTILITNQGFKSLTNRDINPKLIEPHA